MLLWLRIVSILNSNNKYSTNIIHFSISLLTYEEIKLLLTRNAVEIIYKSGIFCIISFVLFELWWTTSIYPQSEWNNSQKSYKTSSYSQHPKKLWNIFLSFLFYFIFLMNKFRINGFRFSTIYLHCFFTIMINLTFAFFFCWRRKSLTSKLRKLKKQRK